MLGKIIKKIKKGRLNGPKVVCVGSSAKDLFFPTTEGQVFDTPDDILSQRKIAFELGAKYQIDDRFESLGGCAANVSAGLARLGTNVFCYTKVGTDTNGEWIISEMEHNGIKTELVKAEEDCKSDVSAIIVDTRSGERVIFFNRDANEKLIIDQELLSDADWLFISGLNGEWDKSLKQILEICRKNSIKLAFNPGQRNIKDNATLIVEAIREADLLMLNKDEAIEILSSGNLSLKKEEAEDETFLLRELSNICRGAVSMTDGQNGAWFISDEQIFRAIPVIVKAIDSTGAGDSFNSAFLDGYIKNLPIEECAKRGIANGSSVVKFFGAIEGLLGEKELSEKSKEVRIEKIR